MEFTTVPVNVWLEKLRESAARGDEVSNPAVKLIDYFERNYKGEAEVRGLGNNHKTVEGVVFETTAAQRDSKALRAAPRMIEDGYVKRFLEKWLQEWKRG